MGIDFIKDFPEYGPPAKAERPLRYLPAGPAADIPPGKSRHYLLGEVPVAVFNLAGDFVACRDRCPHMGAQLSYGRIEGDSVVCFWHGWTFNLRNGSCPVKGWARLETYPVRVRDGVVEVEVPTAPEDAPPR